MPQDERKRQKALMKKRSKQKAHAQQRAQQVRPISSQAILREARTFPLLGCWINKTWNKKDDQGLVIVVVARLQPDGDVCFGTYLIDKFCLGLKNTFARTNYSRTCFQNELDEMFHSLKPVSCPPELAHQMIYAAIDYAAQWGFTPERDYAHTQFLLTPRGELDEPYDLTFGKDGKPFYISGPHDNAGKIIKQLEKTAGPGNFNVLIMSPDAMFLDE